MAEKLIINARRQIGWHRRLLSDVSTAGLWIGWIYLWLPVFRKLHQVTRHHLGLETDVIDVLEAVAPISIHHSVEALLGTSALLLLWTLLPRRQVTQSHAVEAIEDYARYFGLAVQEIEGGRDSRICVVTHDDNGDIVRVEEKT
jgi:poly-beta-1,6-N-acetyl-D-glucosamine biosynthesis protein PgaD